MAVDEAIAVEVGGGNSLPTLRFYGWHPPAVSIGYFQDLDEEVDVGFCAAHGISAVRRVTGGGAVFHGSGELTYSFAAPVEDRAIPRDIQASYEVVCAPIVSALNKLGVAAAFRQVNDIEVGGRKVSGNAQTRRFGAVLQHGTILLRLDRSLLPALRVKKAKLEGKGTSTIAGRVTTLEEVLGHTVRPGHLADLISEEFLSAFGCNAEESRLSRAEEEMVPRLREKYGSVSWLRRR